MKVYVATMKVRESQFQSGSVLSNPTLPDISSSSHKEFLKSEI